MSLASGLYLGLVTHARLRPRRHRLRYRIFQMLIDLDELADLDRLKLFSVGRLNLLSFHDRDFGDGAGALRPYVETLLAGAGIEAGGAIGLLCMPRMLGYAFNPISLYFCHRLDGELAAILYEVRNTFGERHSYLFAASGAVVQTHSCEKQFYVSPFMQMDMTYSFEVSPPDDRMSLAIKGADREGLLIATAFAGRRRELTDGALAAAVLGHPLLTLKVIAGIHWEALLIWLKGVRLTRKPPPPASPVTVASPRA